MLREPPKRSVFVVDVKTIGDSRRPTPMGGWDT
jgi:hypothetical protein